MLATTPRRGEFSTYDLYAFESHFSARQPTLRDETSPSLESLSQSFQIRATRRKNLIIDKQFFEACSGGHWFSLDFRFLSTWPAALLAFRRYSACRNERALHHLIDRCGSPLLRKPLTEAKR